MVTTGNAPSTNAVRIVYLRHLSDACRCCRTISAIDLRHLDRHADALSPALFLGCVLLLMPGERAFAETVRLSPLSIADDMHEKHRPEAAGRLR